MITKSTSSILKLIASALWENSATENLKSTTNSGCRGMRQLIYRQGTKHLSHRLLAIKHLTNILHKSNQKWQMTES